MNKRSSDPWIRYSLKDGAILEISMLPDPVVSDSDGILFIDEETALGFFSGVNPTLFRVQLDQACLIKPDVGCVRTAWHLEDITNGSDSVEVISRNEHGLALRRTDRSPLPMVVYVTEEQDPNSLLGKHVLDPGSSVQYLLFDTVKYSIYARRYV